MEKNFTTRTGLIIGDEGINKLKNSNVIVFGVGGVGSFAAEAIARAGVGNLTIVDFDDVDITNINRQLPALHSTVGKYKVEVMKDRILEILKNKEMTTREIAQELYKRHYTNTADVNNARPRITELESLGFVTTDKTKKCSITNKEVAVYRETTEIEKMVEQNMKHIPRID